MEILWSTKMNEKNTFLPSKSLKVDVDINSDLLILSKS